MVYTNNDPGNPSNAVTDDVLEHEINNNRKAQDGTVQYPEKLCVETPMLESLQMSKKVGYNVFLKLENMQPSGSFKLRGLSHHCIKVSPANFKACFVCRLCWVQPN